jgi:adenine-specific DNA-methyltransferase
MAKKSEVEKLKGEIERLKKELKKRKKYGLVWEEKPEEVVEMCKEKLPVLKEVKNKEIITDKNKPVNLLIEGDNYHALSVLNYTHAKKVDVIYIDPPYNTGNKDFIFNDHYVDSEDAYRHSKWLAFMEKRLKLAKSLLKDSGIIFISIDDNEMAQLKLLMDDKNRGMFGEENFITNIIWHSKTGSSDARTIDTVTEYVLVYAKSKEKVKFLRDIDGYNINRYRFKDEYFKTRGPFYPDNLDRGGLRYSDSLNYQIKCPDNRITYPNGRVNFSKDGWTWKWGKKKVDWGIKNGYIIFKKTKNKPSGWSVYYKNYLYADNEGKKLERGTPYKNLILDIKTGEGSTTIKDMFKFHVFKYSKPVEIIKRLLKSANTDSNLTCLDFMAGSGTTGQAILELNKEDEGNRKFILCTNDENNICTKVCYPRITKVIKGYKNPDGEKVVGLGGNLKYFKTNFVGYDEPTDRNKIKLTAEATEMLCVKEGTFEKVLDQKRFKIFKNREHYTGIILDQAAIPAFKKAIKNTKTYPLNFLPSINPKGPKRIM